MDNVTQGGPFGADIQLWFVSIFIKACNEDECPIFRQSPGSVEANQKARRLVPNVYYCDQMSHICGFRKF
jgi:hypothetical protein